MDRAARRLKENDARGEESDEDSGAGSEVNGSLDENGVVRKSNLAIAENGNGDSHPKTRCENCCTHASGNFVIC